MTSSSHTTQAASQDLLVEFPVLEQVVFLNHAAVSPLPARAARALLTYAEEVTQFGAAVWPRWAARLNKARQRAATMLGAADSEIAFINSTTHGLITLAQSLPFRPGDNIVGGEHEFPANIVPWKNLAERGVALRLVPERPDFRYSLDDYAARIDSRTRLVTVSLVQYSTGYRMPVEKIAELCRKRGVLLCVDGIQGVGAMPVNVKELGCDFLAADGHKWMLGPEGAGFLYVHKDRLELFNRAMTGWTSFERSWDYDDTAQPIVKAARRFEVGAQNMPGLQALDGSISLLTEVGLGEVWRRIEALNERLAEGVRRKGYEVISPRGEGERSGIVAFRKAGIDPAATQKTLETAGIHVSARRNALRVSAHFYNLPEQIDRLVEELP